MFRKKVVALMCFITCVSGVMVSGCNFEADIIYEEESTTHFAEPDLIRHEVGETVECEQFVFNYTSAKQVDSVNGGKHTPEEGMVFYQVEFTVENKLEEETHVNYNCFIGFADGEMVEQFYFTDDILKGNLAKLGDTVSGTLTYSVPENAKEVEIIFQYDMYHEEKKAFKVK